MNLNYLILIYVATILITRIFLKFFPIHGHKIGKLQPHHYMHGIILVLLALLFHWPILLAIGSALIVDEIPLFFIFRTWDWPDNHWKEYHSWKSILGIIIISIIGYIILVWR